MCRFTYWAAPPDALARQRHTRVEPTRRTWRAAPLAPRAMMALHSPSSPPPCSLRDGGGDSQDALSLALSSPPCSPAASADDCAALRLKFARANTLVASILNKFYNGSARAVDPFVIRYLQEEETRLFSLQCFIEQGPTETARERKESAAMRSAAAHQQPTLLSRLFSMCGGYMGGPGSVMRQWDALSCTTPGLEDAMSDYIAIVDKILPGWDRPLPHEFPIAHQDKFWKDDMAVDQCQACGSGFTAVNCRRHHCRMCFDIFCGACCAEFIDMALCPGAPVRRQRVCLQCFEDAEKDRSLLVVRRLIRENHELERKIKELTSATQQQIEAKQKEEAKLRLEAGQCGCDLAEIDAATLKLIGSPVSIAVKLPPAHKFTPRETADANDQVALAHRQLLMGLKGAQCRAKKALEKMEVALRVLRDAICFGSGTGWNVMLRGSQRELLTLREVYVLSMVSHAMRGSITRYRCDSKSVLRVGVVPLTWRPFLWQAHWLKDDKTRQYISDLADVIRTRIESSDSESDETEQEEGDSRTLMQVTPHALLGAHLHPSRRSVWKNVYEFVLTRCDEDATSLRGGGSEFDAQIQGDVGRTFGVSSLRGRQSPAAKKAAAAQRKAYQCASASTLETPLALRRTALTNVLRAFASVNSEIGYCQGMDHVTAILLSVVDWNESDAFWMLTSLVAAPQYELEKLYGPGLPGLNLRVYQLEKLMARHLPELHAHVQEIEFPISMVSTSWFLTLFCNMDALSYDLVLRVLDGFAVSGWKFVFRVALAILEALQHHMLASTFEEMPQVFYDLHSVAPQFASADARPLVAKAMQFKVTNSLLQTLVDEYEQSGGADVPTTTRRESSRSKAPRQAAMNGSMANGQAVRTAVIPSETLSAPGAPADTHAVHRPMPVAVAAIASLSNGGSSTRHASNSPSTTLPTHPSPTKSPVAAAGRRSRHSSSTSNDSDSSGRKSPDATRAATPPSPFFSAPPRYETKSESTMHYGLATPLNANYYF